MNPKPASPAPLPDLSLACLLALSDDEWSKHILDEYQLGEPEQTDLKALERSLAIIALKIAERAVYLRWRLMLRKCGPTQAHAKAKQYATFAKESLSKHLMRRPKKT